MDSSENKKTTPGFLQGATGSASFPKDEKPHIVFAGRSNVGKSSTINSLLGRRLARSSSTPGKTREMNFYERGDTHFVDLPGYGYAKVSKVDREKMLKRMLWYLEEYERQVRLLIVILDAKAGVTELDKEFLAETPNTIPVLLVVNKADKLTQKEKSALEKQMKIFTEEVGGSTTYVLYSALKGLNKESVLARIEEALH